MKMEENITAQVLVFILAMVGFIWAQKLFSAFMGGI